jgi:hypothetical protein
MNAIARLALGALMSSGVAIGLTAPADARVFVGIGVGGGGGYYGPPSDPYDYNDAYCDPDSRWYDPYRCPAYDYWYDPIYIDGAWVHGPFRWRWEDGHRVFWYRHDWRTFDGGHAGGEWHDHGGHDWHDNSGDWHDHGGDWHDHGGDHGDHGNGHWHH